MKKVSLPATARQARGFIEAVLVVLLLLVSFVLWLVTTTSGATLALRLGVEAVGGGVVRDVRGSLWGGLGIGHLEYGTSAFAIKADDLVLQIAWPGLRERHVDVRRLTAGAVHVDLFSTEEEPPAQEPMTAPTLPELPVTATLRRFEVGKFSLTQDGKEIPVRLENLVADLVANGEGVRLGLRRLTLFGPDAKARIEGDVAIGPEHPMGVDATFTVDARQAERQATVRLSAQGSLENLGITIDGAGEGLDIKAVAQAHPFSAQLPLSALDATVHGLDLAAWVEGLPEALIHLSVSLALEGELLPAAEPVAPVTAVAGAGGASGTPSPAKATQTVPDPLARLARLKSRLDLTIEEGSRWNGQPLRADVHMRSDGVRLPALTADIRAGRNTIKLDGALGAADDGVRFRFEMPAPDQLWPGLDTGLRGDLAGELRGLPEQHVLKLKGRINLPASWTTAASAQVKTVAKGVNEVVEPDSAVDLPAAIRKGPLDIELALKGQWGGQTAAHGGTVQGWRGSIGQLAVRNPEVGLALGSPVDVDIRLASGNTPLAWSVSNTTLRLALPQNRNIVVVHKGSSGEGAHWRSAGQVDGLTPAWLVAQLPRVKDPLRLDIVWDLAMTNTLAGTVDLRRRSGDLAAPGDPPQRLGLQTLALRAEATPGSGNSSRLAFSLQLVSEHMGRVSAQGTTAIVTRNGVPELPASQRVEVDTDVAVDELEWVSAFIGDATEIGGKLAGRLRFVREGGQWQASGGLNGSNLRVVHIDQGIRLLNGSLKVRVDSEALIIDSLRFPSVIRSSPKDSRIQAWLAQNGDKGYIDVTGRWSLADAAGQAHVTVKQFPVVQRADRFIAATGEIDIDATPSRMRINGDVTADVGWISLEGASDLPSLDSDVVIVRADDKAPDESQAMNLLMRLNVDLGKQFYLRGMGLDTALEGKINIRNTRSGLRANGVVNTREGRFSIYGQTLVVRRGEVTFQNRLDDPLLDVIAVRQGLRVEAGVQVSGTARAPVITLVSFPDVPETEKLSWLLLGRSPDASGADAGMLLAAAASLLTDEGSEPIYRQLGLDELGLRSGLGTGVRGLLPDTTVVTSIDKTSDANAETQFLVVGKRLTDAIYLTFEQALSGHETVVRATYRLTDNLSAIAQGGTLNGLRLVWSLVFDD